MSRRERPAGAGLGSAVPSHPQAALGEPVADSADVFLFAGSPAVGLKASSSPGALSAPSPEGAPRGVLGTSADDTVWISAMGAFRGVGQIVSGGTGSGSVGGLGSGGGSGSGPGIGGVGEGGSGVSFGMGRVCPRRVLRKRGQLLSDQILAWSARRGSSSRTTSDRAAAATRRAERIAWSSVSYETRSPLIPSTVTVQSSPRFTT